MISLLLACRKDSKFLAKFLLTFMVNTSNFSNVELLILTPPGGTWNKELLTYFKDRVKVIDDDTDLGRGGGHVFYDILAKEAKGDWLWYLCDDHYLMPDYDQIMVDFIKAYNLDPNKLNVIAPAVDNSGRISHILSRKFYETVGFGPQGNVDSCLNDTLEYLELIVGKEEHDKVLHLPLHPVMHDFSLDKDLFKNVGKFDEQYEINLFKSQEIRDKIHDNAKKLAEVLK